MHIQGKSVSYMQPINIVDFYITWSKKALDSTTKSSFKTGQLNWRKTELCDPEALTLSLFVNIRSRTCPHTGLRIPSRGEHFKTMNIYSFMGFFWHAVVSLKQDAHWPHRSPEIQFQFEQIYHFNYTITLIERKFFFLLFEN